MCNSIDKMECAKTKEEYIKAAVRFIENDIDKQRVAMELRNHIEDRAQYYREIGFDAKTAMQKAVEQMGDPEEISAPLSDLHPKGRIWTAVLAVLGAFFLLFVIGVYNFFFTLDDGVIGFGISELLLLSCIIGLSILGKKRKNRFLCALSVAVFCLTGLVRLSLLAEGWMPCSPIVLAFFSIITGDFACLGMYGRVGNVTVAPWLSYTTAVFYILILFVLIAASRSVRKLHQPTYSLFNDKLCKRVDRIQKGLLSVSAIIVCISLVTCFFSILFGHYPTDPVANVRPPSFNTVAILQSDTPCSIEEVNPSDVLVLEPNWDWSKYIFEWVYRSYCTDIDAQTEFIARNTIPVACGNMLEYGIKKDVVTVKTTKKYVYMCFFYYPFEPPYAYPTPDNISDFITLSEGGWQQAESVAPICVAYDTYNCVEIIVNAS